VIFFEFVKMRVCACVHVCVSAFGGYFEFVIFPEFVKFSERDIYIYVVSYSFFCFHMVCHIYMFCAYIGVYIYVLCIHWCLSWWLRLVGSLKL